jgi:hypothetical protein
MRINRLPLAGLAVALVGVGAKDAAADDLVISTATTTPVTTNPAANGTAGDVTIAAGGSITISAGEAAVTVNSSNDVTVASGGSIASNDADGVTGILLQGGNTGVITNSGAINLLESYVLVDSDNDGNLDGLFAIGSDRHGIRLQAGPTFTGDIINTNSISIEGISSTGIRLDALLTGDLTSIGQRRHNRARRRQRRPAGERRHRRPVAPRRHMVGHRLSQPQPARRPEHARPGRSADRRFRRRGPFQRARRDDGGGRRRRRRPR